MQNLENYVGFMNAKKSMFGEDLLPTLDSFNQDSVNEVYDSLFIDMEPENLHEDGEISYEEADEKYRYYTSVHEELMNLGKRLGLDVKEDLE